MVSALDGKRARVKFAIIGGTGIYSFPGLDPTPRPVATPFGEACYYATDNPNLIFLARHGLGHSTPPHRIGYRANFWALHQIGVEAALATYAVGSIHVGVGLRSLSVLTDFLDTTSGRERTYFEGGSWGVGHADMTSPYCPALNAALLERASSRGLEVRPSATYACTNGPRFESPAEIRDLAGRGADVVGMTGLPEVALARELGIHFAGIALSMNLAVGLEETLHIAPDLGAQRQQILDEPYPTGLEQDPCYQKARALQMKDKNWAFSPEDPDSPRHKGLTVGSRLALTERLVVAGQGVGFQGDQVAKRLIGALFHSIAKQPLDKVEARRLQARLSKLPWTTEELKSRLMALELDEIRLFESTLLKFSDPEGWRYPAFWVHAESNHALRIALQLAHDPSLLDSGIGNDGIYGQCPLREDYFHTYREIQDDLAVLRHLVDLASGGPEWTQRVTLETGHQAWVVKRGRAMEYWVLVAPEVNQWRRVYPEPIQAKASPS